MQTLKGRTCVMAGAAQGDGRETVKSLCAGGMNVVIMTHQAQMAASLIEEVESAGSEGKCVVVEGKEGCGPAELQPDVYEKITGMFGSVDVVICNTGGSGKQMSLEDVDSEMMMRDVKHLTEGSFGMLKAALPYLRKSSNPRVIFMTTVEGCYGGRYESFVNAVAKGTVRSLTLNAAARLAADGITVNAISKGPIPRVEGIREGDADPADMLPLIPMKRLGTAKDLAETICFFASEESSFITGQILAVDGGLSVGL
ncbi:MAG: SDR family oxidoreductase [Ruminococcus sp.]|nr:SDR family oxidoreductase [Ruminococcus sp.]